MSVTIAKPGKVATIGYQQPEAWQIISCMVEEQGWHRYDRNSYWAKWSERALRQEFGYRYHPVPEMVNLHELEHDRPARLVDPAAGLANVSTWLDAGMNCLLMCRCPNWQLCHRKQVTALLQHAYPNLEVAHLLCDPLAVELPVILSKAVELLQRYGLLKPLPHAPMEQPVMLRTPRSQQLVLPDFGPCMMSLSVTLWLTDPQQPRKPVTTVPQPQENEEGSVDAVPPFTTQQEQRG
jgi:hypothetical protein